MSADAIHAVTMPRWGMTMTEGLVAAWLVEPGAEVAAGQEILEIETSKITNVLEATASGTLRRRVVEVGGTAPVGALLGVLAAPAVGDDEIDRFVAGHAAAEGAGATDEQAVPAEARQVDLGNGRALAVGRLGAGDGAPIVLVHGFGGDRKAWLFNQGALADGRPVLAVDLPGHGESGPPGDEAGVAGLARDLVAAARALDLGPVHLVGHSLGAAVALHAAHAEPSLARSLTLIAPAGFGENVDAGYLEGFLAAQRRKPMKEALERLFADPSLVSGEMVEGTLRMKRLDGAEAALRRIADAAFPGGRQADDLRPAVTALEAPVLVIWGEADAVIPAGHAEGLPVRVEIVAGAGHMPQMERAAEVNRLVAAHVAAAETP